jgi:hypothetical protein
MSLPPDAITPEVIQYAIDNGLPLQLPPEGTVANLENPDSLAYQLYITAGVCITLMVIFTVFRLLHVCIITSNRKYLLDEGM